MLGATLTSRALRASASSALRLVRSQRCVPQVLAYREAHKQTHAEVAENTSQVFNLEGRVAFITGASGGVGSAAALALARCGADVYLTDAVAEKLPDCEKLKLQIEDLGRTADIGICDVRDPKSVSAAIEGFSKRFEKMDILVANAGILGQMEQPEDITEENWKNVFSVNVDGVMHTARAAYPMLKKSSNGKVIIMSSVAGISGYGPQAPYCASKGALIPLAKSLALAWAKDNINVNVVMPGAINTPFVSAVLDHPEKLAYLKDRIPMSRLAEPSEIAGPILFFASSASNYCTGSVLVVDGGGTSRAMAQERLSAL